MTATRQSFPYRRGMAIGQGLPVSACGEMTGVWGGSARSPGLGFPPSQTLPHQGGGFSDGASFCPSPLWEGVNGGGNPVLLAFPPPRRGEC